MKMMLVYQYVRNNLISASMKKMLSLFTMLLYCMAIQAQEKTVEQPSFSAWTSSTLEIQKIALSDTATVFYIDAYYSPNQWIKVVSKTYLQTEGKKYPIRSANGFELDKEVFMPASGTISFQLIFPPLPAEVKEINFIEGHDRGAFCIYGIRLDGKPASSSFAGRQMPKETPVLEEPVLKAATATLKGKVAGYLPEMNAEGRAWASSVITGGADEYTFKVQDDGSFTLDVPMLHIGSVGISANFMNTKLYLKPGETTSVEINMPEICRTQSRIQKEKPSLGVKYYFSGALAALNNEISNSPVHSLPVGIGSQAEYEQMFKDVSNMNAEQFKKYWMDRREKGMGELAKYPEISDAFRSLLIQDANMETAQQLLGTYLIEYAYRQVNKIPRDSAAVGFVKPEFNMDYYDFMPEFIPNSPQLLYTGNLAYMLRGMQYANFSGKPLPANVKELPDNTAELAQIMGADNGLLFDLIAAQKLAKPIQEFQPLSDEQLAQANKISPAIGNLLADMNKKVKQTIEENKKKSGYTVDRINTADIPAEELFNAITTPYRGKVVFVDFWATWCGPCKMAMKDAEPVKKDFEGKEIVFLYLAAENSPKGTWDQMITDIKGEHYRVTDAQWSYWAKKFGIQGVPSYMILAKDGTPVHFQVGFMGADKMKEMLNNELDK